MNDNQPRDSIDWSFAMLVIVAMVCLVGMIYVLFPRHDEAVTGFGKSTSRASDGSGSPAQSTDAPPTKK